MSTVSKKSKLMVKAKSPKLGDSKLTGKWKGIRTFPINRDNLP